jgi:hypothetical protein
MMLRNGYAWGSSTRRSLRLAGCAGAAALALGAPSAFAGVFDGADLVVSSLTYTGDASTVTMGQTLPGGGTAIADGTFPGVWANNTVDGSFGVTAPYSLEVFRTGHHGTSITLKNSVPVTLNNNNFVGSFSSKSEGAINLSSDGRSLTIMGYASTPNQLDVSNANTPGHVDSTNPVSFSAQRAVAKIDVTGTVKVTDVNAYSGNNGRAVILADGSYYMVGNAGNGTGNEPPQIVGNTGVEMITAGQSGETTKVGAFDVKPYNGGKNDKVGKDDNYRGLTIFDNTIYVTKGSGSNGIDTVYQVGNVGSLPTLANAATTTISILPGFPTGLAKTNAANFFPFGIWFANATTLYVADEGDGVAKDAATDANAGLEKWSFFSGSWHKDYTLQSGLGLGTSYGVSGYPANLDPATDGLRNITGKVNADGTVTIYGLTSTVSANGDQGADPNRLVAINDQLSAMTLPNGESFTVLQTAGFGQVLRGVSLAPVPEPGLWSLMILGLGGLGASLRGRRRSSIGLSTEA